MQKWVFVASLCLAAALVAIWFDVDWAIGERKKHCLAPDDVVQIGKEWMTQETVLLTRIHPRASVGAIRFALLRRRNLYPVLYLLCGFAGACAAIWLLLMRDQFTAKATNWDRAGAAVLLSALAGLIAYLLVKWLASATSRDALKTYDDWEVFPLLAGAFNTVFYDALPGLLTALLEVMKTAAKKWKTVAIIIAFAPVLVSRSAQAQESKTVSQSDVTKSESKATNEDAAYYKCSDPTSCKCWAFTKQERAECKECTKWLTVTIDDRVMKLLRAEEPAAYSNHASRFARDAAERLYHLDVDDSMTVAQLYRDPSDFGFREVAAAGASPRTLVVYPNLAGVVANAKGDIAYTSGKRQAYNIVPRLYLKEEGKAKYLVPAAASPEKAKKPQ
jgi:hypothetical protein